MTSLQAKIARMYLRMQKRLRPKPVVFDIQKERQSLEELARLFKPLAPVNITTTNIGTVQAEWITTPDFLSDSVILYLHGGGYCAGSIQSHRAHAANLALAAGIQVLIIEYSLAPEHPYPAALDEATGIFRWLLGQGYESQDIIIAGDSAGGGLAVALLIRLRDQNSPLPAACVCLSPWTDLSLSGESYKTNAKKDVVIDYPSISHEAQLYLSGNDPRTPSASPIFADLSGLPPLLVQVGSDEMLLSDSTVFAERARQAGVDVTLEVWEEMQHVWHFSANLVPEARRAVERVGVFIRAAMK